MPDDAKKQLGLFRILNGFTGYVRNASWPAYAGSEISDLNDLLTVNHPVSNSFNIIKYVVGIFF
jgi:hypothetical protein